MPLGLLAQQVWARDANDVGKRARRKQLPITQKESQKWLWSLGGCLQCPRGLSSRACFVSVGDREADIYDVLAAQRPAGVELLIRAAWNRCVQCAPSTYTRATVAGPARGRVHSSCTYHGVARKPAREARLALRSCSLTLVSAAPPRQAEGLPTVTRWAVQVHEKPGAARGGRAD